MTYKRVTVFTHPACSASKIVKEYLSFEHILYEEIDIVKNPDGRKKMIEQYHSHATPTVVVSGKVIKGLNLERLEQILKG
ncbi:glutaredoxin family protein [Bacillus tianshenii]|nr:glutaredoxin family protein [Bacillus tianshenii]